MGYFIHNRGLAFGIDISRYQADAELKRFPDFDAIRAHEPRVAFIGMRAGISWGYKDPAFERFYQEGERIGACLLPYHVVFPSEPALKQMDFFLKNLKSVDLERVRLVLDMEVGGNLGKGQITQTLLLCLEALRKATGRWPIIYSRALWIDAHVAVEDLPEVDWWLAQYLSSQKNQLYTAEYPCPPKLPKGVKKWLIHQTTERGPAIGGLGGCMDYDRWNGGNEAVLAYFGRAAVGAGRACPLDGKPCCREAAESGNEDGAN